MRVWIKLPYVWFFVTNLLIDNHVFIIYYQDKYEQKSKRLFRVTCSYILEMHVELRVSTSWMTGTVLKCKFSMWSARTKRHFRWEEHVHMDRLLHILHFCYKNMIPLHRACKSRRTLQNEVRIKVFPEQLTLFINTFVALKQCIIQ